MYGSNASFAKCDFLAVGVRGYCSDGKATEGHDVHDAGLLASKKLKARYTVRVTVNCVTGAVTTI